MFFLLRMAFWLGVVCVLLPAGGSQPAAPDAKIDAVEAVTVASAAVSDMRGFCDRQPEACKAGGKIANAIGHKAEAGARTLYRLITAQIGGSATPTAAPSEPPKIAPVQSREATAHDRGTLVANDLQPTWRGPAMPAAPQVQVPLPPRRPARPQA